MSIFFIAAKIGTAVLITVSAAMLVIAVTLEKREGGKYVRLANDFVQTYKETDAGFLDFHEGGDGGDGGAKAEEIKEKENRLKINFSTLEQINSDIAGWIYIEDTPVNYPVVQAGDNSKYLQTSFFGDSNKLGAIFLDKDLDFNDSGTLIIYGHNMGFGRNEMFSTLRKYGDINYLAEHPVIITQTKEEIETEWEIFAVADINTRDMRDMSLYRQGGLFTEESREDYLGILKDLELYDTGTLPETGSRLLILSTCTGDGRENMRRLVLAYSLNSQQE